MSSPADALIAVTARGQRTEVRLASYLAPEDAEAAERRGNEWIKSLRHVCVDGVPLRQQLRYGDDTLWWFAEIYLHKFRTVALALAARAAASTLVVERRPERLELLASGHVAREVLRHVAADEGVSLIDSLPRGATSFVDDLAAALMPTLRSAGAVARRWRTRRQRPAIDPVDVVVFLHHAFWDPATGQDTYLGPLVQALRQALGDSRIALVGLGPETTFRARTLGRRVREFRGQHIGLDVPVPVEAFAAPRGSAASRALSRHRRRFASMLANSRELRAAAIVDGLDLWPLLQSDFAKLATLQLPWAGRAMDEIGGALDGLRPRVAVTYAEAGGWGRAIAMEARRRSISFVGIQHGLISRHWLNYLHEDDEGRSQDGTAGFPFPDETLLFDDFARRHLLDRGRFPADRLRVVGNHRMDRLVQAAGALTAADVARVKSDIGANADQHLVLLAAKRIPEFDDTLAALMRAAHDLGDVFLAVRPHPAETAAPYEHLAAGLRNVRIVSPQVSAVALMAASRLVATINSTMAIEAMALDVPALAMRLPNYLSPFVDEGAMAGTFTPAGIRPAVDRLVHDDEFRRELAQRRAAFMARYGMRPDGGTVDRTVAAVSRLLERHQADDVRRIRREEKT